MRLFALCLLAAGLAVQGATAEPIGRFGPSDFGDWTAGGAAFAKGPAAAADLLTRLEIENALPGGVASSEIEGDGPQGTLTSPPFMITRRFIAFRIGGGDDERSTCVRLLIDGQIAKTATGWKSDRLAPASWDVSEFAGKTAVIEIVDQSSGDWGHINVNAIEQTDTPERPPVAVAPLYRELLRPQFHFTARQWTTDRLNPQQRQEGWINDLNGLIYYDGEYHLFAQRWAKCWLHAVSRDLVHWTELPPAFWEEQAGVGDQSGTCVVDYENTSGLSPDKRNPPLVAFWSRFDNHSQCITYSLDHGRTWKAYEKNPYMDYPERDPKVFWYAPGRHWVMMLYGGGKYHILTSHNLLQWKDENHPIADSFECPDFFELPVDGDPHNKKWVLIQGNGNYSIGAFDGTEFKEETKRFPCDVGRNFYATQSWHNVETGDGRRIQAAWVRGPAFPDMPFNQQVSFPCELTLHNTPAGLRLYRKPIPAIAALHQAPDQWTNRTLRADETLPLEPSGREYHLVAEVEIPDGAKLTFKLRGTPITLTSRGAESGTVQDRIKTVEILLDRASIETFANDGEVSSTRFMLPSESGLSVKAEGGEAVIKSLSIYPLKSAWTDPPAR